LNWILSQQRYEPLLGWIYVLIFVDYKMFEVLPHLLGDKQIL